MISTDPAPRPLPNPGPPPAPTSALVPPAPIPKHEDFSAPNEFIVHVAADAQPDGFNRVQFVAHWLTDQEWVPGGVRGQVFRADLGEFVAKHEREGRPVRIAGIGGGTA